MKTNLIKTILVILVISISFYGCKGKLQGTWYYQKIDHLGLGETETSWNGACPYMYFGNDSAFVLNFCGGRNEGKWYKKDSVIHVIRPEGYESEFIIESISSDKLVLNYINIQRIYLTKEKPENCASVH